MTCQFWFHVKSDWQKKQFLTIWNYPKMISRKTKIWEAWILLNFHTVSCQFCFHVKSGWRRKYCRRFHVFPQFGKMRNSLSPKNISSDQLLSKLSKPLLSRNFCQKCVREISRNFHTYFDWVTQIIFSTLNSSTLLFVNQIDLTNFFPGFNWFLPDWERQPQFLYFLHM